LKIDTFRKARKSGRSDSSLAIKQIAGLSASPSGNEALDYSIKPSMPWLDSEIIDPINGDISRLKGVSSMQYEIGPSTSRHQNSGTNSGGIFMPQAARLGNNTSRHKKQVSVSRIFSPDFSVANLIDDPSGISEESIEFSDGEDGSIRRSTLKNALQRSVEKFVIT